MTDLDRLIELYGMDVTDDLEVSPFEYVETFLIRSEIENNYEKLNEFQKKKLEEYDKILLKRAKEFVCYLKEPFPGWNNKEPKEHWWWHLDKVLNDDN
ncbi:hypothetical protein SAMN02745135_01117 [Caloranaerobacter azorensis DSM 13643]|nr:hypothetical protein [Caloranaerobacter azorensis]SHH53419.1 hypothetical protein SAMN02745135_01117 [Caloranaerobacter azorensis DSM 13643]